MREGSACGRWAAPLLWRAGDEMLAPHVLTCQGGGSQVLEKSMSWVVKWTRGSGEICQGAEKEFTVVSFLQ